MRWVKTRVLPEPAPAKMRSGPSVWRTASRWGGFRFSRKGFMVVGAILVIARDFGAGLGEYTRVGRTQGSPLLHRHTFRQISRLIHVVPFIARHLIGEQLEGNRGEQGIKDRFRLRDEEDFIDLFLKFSVPFCADGDHQGAPSQDLLKI